MVPHTVLTLLVLITLSTTVLAHNVQSWPPAMGSRFNPLTPSSQIDYDIQGPLSSSLVFPCKNLHLLPQSPAATLAAGVNHNITFIKEYAAPHDFGSMQVALSYDDAKTFYVIHSWQGQAADPERRYNFVVPRDAKVGEALFSWTWINKKGAREFYMACSAVAIAPAPPNAIEPATPFNQRPDIFVAQLDDECKVEWDHDVLYPEPGPSVDVTTDIVGKSQKMSYNRCKPVNGVGNHPRGRSAGAGAAGKEIEGGAQATVLAMDDLTATSKVSLGPSILPHKEALDNSSSILIASLDNTCGQGTNLKCQSGQCCSKHGYCGDSPSYCGLDMCQPGYGKDCDGSLGGPVSSGMTEPSKTSFITKTVTKTVKTGATA